jgi:hypothetical protein
MMLLPLSPADGQHGTVPNRATKPAPHTGALQPIEKQKRNGHNCDAIAK